MIVYWTDNRFLTKDEVRQLPKDAKRNLNASPAYSFQSKPSGNTINKTLAKWIFLAFICVNGIFLARYAVGNMGKNKQNKQQTKSKL